MLVGACSSHSGQYMSHVSEERLYRRVGPGDIGEGCAVPALIHGIERPLLQSVMARGLLRGGKGHEDSRSHVFFSGYGPTSNLCLSDKCKKAPAHVWVYPQVAVELGLYSTINGHLIVKEGHTMGGH